MAEVELLAELDAARGLMAGNPLLLPPGALVDALNVTWRNGRLKKRRGYVVLKANGVGGKRVRMAHYFSAADSTARLAVATQTTLFSWNPATSTFDNKGALGGTDIPALGHCDWGVGMMYMAKPGQAFNKWDGGAGNFLPTGAINPITGTPLYPGHLRAYMGSLVAANDGNNQQTVWWSDVLNPDVFNAGSAGYNTLVDARGSLTGLELVGKSLGVWAEESIHTMLYTGVALLPYVFQRAEATVGARSPESIKVLGPPFAGQVAFFGSDLNIHTFDGLRAVPQADIIHSILKDTVEQNYVSKAAAMVWPREAIYWLALPSVGKTENDLVLEWHYRLGQFYLHKIGSDGAWTAIARFPKSAALTWAELEALGTTWADLDKSWAELAQETGNVPVGFLGANGDFMQLFEGLLDGALGISSHAQYAPFETPSHEIKESAYLEVLEDRQSDAACHVGLGASRDGASFTQEIKAHALIATDRPIVGFRMQGRWFQVGIASGANDGDLSLRGWKLYALPAVGRER